MERAEALEFQPMAMKYFAVVMERTRKAWIAGFAIAYLPRLLPWRLVDRQSEAEGGQGGQDVAGVANGGLDHRGFLLCCLIRVSFD
jgi:hypothetical protein